METVNKFQGDWFFYVFLICLSLIALQKSVWYGDLKFYFRTLLDFNLRKPADDLQHIKLNNFFPIYINYVIGLTLVILMFFHVAFDTGGLRLDFSGFLRLLIGLSVYLIFKNFMQQFVLLLFVNSEASDSVNRYSELGNSIIGMLSTPLLLISYYTLHSTTFMLWITIALGSGLYLYNITKIGWLMYSALRLSPLFILVYLCSIEIMPVIWITGWMSNKI